jgi:diguanylate cyclase (GGDEF)-like protein
VQRLLAETQALSHLDPLTGLFNRRFLVAQATRMWRQARRDGTRVAAMMLDLDHFKRLNDEHGHEAGDAALAAVADAIQTRLRESDFASRWGGEEFLVLLPDTRPDGAMRVAETLRRDIAETPIPWNVETVTVTASFGVACARPDEVDADALVGRADAAMYGAKEDGRNRVRLAADRGPIAHPRSA